MEGHLLIYTPKLTPRISYAFSLFFESLINTPYKIVTDVTEYKNYKGPKLNYSGSKVDEKEIFIHDCGLLNETGIREQSISVTEWEGLKIFFRTDSGSLPFDVLAASFYLVTRYEEYLPSQLDKHNRFQPANSLAFKSKFLDVPLVNLWAEKLKSLLVKANPGIVINERSYTFIPTIDVDVAYAHKGRKLYVTIGSYVKAIATFNFGLIGNKTTTLLGLRPDDYDTYEYQNEIFRRENVNPICFILAGKRGPYDKNISTGSSYFKSLVKKLGFRGNIGVHPSYRSMNDVEIVMKEKDIVEKNFRGKITKSRQHYLRIKFPETYRCLSGAGITDDYSMGYAASPGFRASICTPYYFYDLKAEEALPIKLHPFMVMDGTLNEYICVTPDEAISLTKKLIEQVRQCNGEFIAIWHNDTLNDKGKWKGWKRVFETIMEAAK